MGFGFGGFGMMGGGPGGQFSISTMYGMLLGTPTVQKDLELVDEQKEKLKSANEKAQAAWRQMFSGMGNMQDLSDEERKSKMEEMRKKGQAQAEASKKAIEEILLPHQLERIKGIALQRVGTGALNDKQIQQDLKMSEDQVAKLKSIGEESGKKMQEIGKETQTKFMGVLTEEQKELLEKAPRMGFGGPPGMGAGPDLKMSEEQVAKQRSIGEESRKKMQGMRTQIEKDLMDVLTAEQKETLEKMKGEKLDIPESELRPRFAGPGGPGGGERRRPPPKKDE
jgi:hypothetical protein